MFPSSFSGNPSGWSLDLFGEIDYPRSGESVGRGRLTVCGWAIDRLGPIAAIIVVVDGGPAGWAQRGIERPDLVPDLGDFASVRTAGWVAEIDLAEAPDDGVVIGVEVLRCDGARVLLAESVVGVQPAPEAAFAGRFDPRVGERRAGTALYVSGWAVCQDSPVARVRLFVDGRPAGLARYGIPRQDVARRRRSYPHALLCGFDHILDLTPWPGPGTLHLDAVAETLDGRSFSVPGSDVWLEAAPAEAPADEFAPSRRRRAAWHAGGRIRVVAFTHSLGLGGGQWYLHEVIRRLAPGGRVDWTVVSPEDGALRAPSEDLGAAVHIAGPYLRPGLDDRGYDDRVDELAAWVERGGFDVVLVNTLGAGPGVDVAAHAGLPSVWAIHESLSASAWAYESQVSEAALRRTRSALRRAGLLVFESEATAALFRPYTEAGRWLVLPYGIDVDAIAEYRAGTGRPGLRRDLGLSPGASVLLCLGTITTRKSQAMLVRAFAEVAGDFPEAQLVLVGDNGGPLPGAIREFARGSGIADRVRVEAVTPDTYAWYAAADAFVLPSDLESMPRSILEAMAFELPVLSTTAFGIPELVTDGVTGYLCPPRDLRALTDGLRRLLSAPAAERETMVREALGVVRRSYDSAGYATAYQRLFEELVGAGG